MNEVRVALGPNCTFQVRPNIVAEFNRTSCDPDQMKLIVVDRNDRAIPGNLLNGEHAGQRLKYFISHPVCNPQGCWGELIVEDKNTPQVVEQEFFKEPIICNRINDILNNPLSIGYLDRTRSPRQIPSGTILNYSEAADDVPNLGIVRFSNCDPDCPLTVKWSDRLEVYGCDSLAKDGLYARIYRVWVATNCQGRSLSVTQKINICRPAVSAFQFRPNDADPVDGYDHVVIYKACKPDKSLIQRKDVTPFAYKVRGETGAVNDTIFLDQEPCNYSMQFEDKEFVVCEGRGVKIDRAIKVFDWCNGGVVKTFHVLIKIGDFEAPSFVQSAHHVEKPVELSTSPLNCEASLPVTIKGLKEVLGVDVKDNCLVSHVTVKVTSQDRYSKGFIIASKADNEAWFEESYPVANGVLSGLNPGRHRVNITAYDGCYNSAEATFEIVVLDKISPVMVIDDQLNVSLTSTHNRLTGYARVCLGDIDEGSSDNCQLRWMKVRRNVPASCIASFIEKGYDTNGNGKLDPLPENGDTTNIDGFDYDGDGRLASFGETFIVKNGKLMTPLLDCVDFFCCDVDAKVTLELWGEDLSGNRNYAWADILVEDKIYPTCNAPRDVTLLCTDKCIAALDSRAAAVDCFGDIFITSGNDCKTLDTTYQVIKKLKCGIGTVERIWTITKQTSKGPVSSTCKQVITILPVHEYNICFPKDAVSNCTTPVVDTLLADELACDILSINVNEKRYDASGDECYKILRTYTVINWCTFEDRCGDPMSLKNLLVIDRGTFNNYGKSPIYMLVRDRGYKTNLRAASLPNQPYPQPDRIKADGIPPSTHPNQAPRDKNGPMTLQTWEYNASSPEFEFIQDGWEEFWISADLIPGNQSALQFGDNDSSSDNNTKRDLLVNNSMAVTCGPTPVPRTEPSAGLTSEALVHGFMYTQIIKVYDNERPKIQVPTLDPFATRAEDCLADVTIRFSATDNCADQLELERGQLMIAPFQSLDPNKMIPFVTPRWFVRESSGNTYQITVRDLPEGKHDLIVVVRDECGNLSLPTRIPFVVVDAKGPAPICINGLATELMPDGNGGGMMTIWANDFIGSKVYDCNGQGPETKDGLKLVTKYSINRVGETPNPNQTGLTITCADAGVTIFVEIHAWDAVGNHDFCVTYLLAQDNRSICPAGVSYQGEITGLITTDDAKPLAGVQVQVNGAANHSTASTATGKFSFARLQQGQDYSIVPQLDKDHRNGVSTFDLVIVQRHILGTQLMTDPYQLIAADVNNSKAISTLDLIQIRKLVLGVDERFTAVPSWRFIDAKYQFPQPANPWATSTGLSGPAFPEAVNINDLNNKAQADFIAVKMGDVNGSVTTSAATSSTLRSNTALEIRAERLQSQRRSVQQGEGVSIALRADDLAQIQGYQFSLGFDLSVLELERMDYHSVKPEHIAVFADQGDITFSWYDPARPAAAPLDPTLLILHFRAKKAGNLPDLLHIHSRRTPAEAYTRADELIGVELGWANGDLATRSLQLLQNVPNPFKDQTVIGFSLPESGQATLRIHDVNGRVLWSVSQWFAKGSNQVEVKQDALRTAGVLYYTLEAGADHQTKKMVILE